MDNSKNYVHVFYLEFCGSSLDFTTLLTISAYVGLKLHTDLLFLFAPYVLAFVYLSSLWKFSLLDFTNVRNK